MKLGIIEHALLVKVQELIQENAALRTKVSELEKERESRAILVDVKVTYPQKAELGKAELEEILRMGIEKNVKRQD